VVGIVLWGRLVDVATLSELVTGLWLGLAFGLGVGLVAWLVYPQSWASALAFAQLAASNRTPVRLMRSFEDARSRSVLRTVGPVYQFRHARLQDRLAAQEPANGQHPGGPRPTAGNAAAPTAEAPSASSTEQRICPASYPPNIARAFGGLSEVTAHYP
jgi:hypothetical protein